ncbi:hypothetical protein J7K27_03435 [Candidatus Bathyarchaeota archaeon]|nr:hypothetical protein [Candidatus Bathyarchaeota archaeon]
MSKQRVVSDLEATSRGVGRLYPVLLDRHGNVIDGMHRLKADKNWPKIRLENIETEEQRLIARLIANVCRRNVPAKEKTQILAKLAEIYQKEGVKPGKIAYKIAEKTGMSYRWVMKYLPDKFKDNLQSQRRTGAVARCATRKNPKHVIPLELEEPPKGALAIKTYRNTNFVNIMLQKKFYRQLEETAQKLKTTPDKLIYNAILLIIKSLTNLTK